MEQQQIKKLCGTVEDISFRKEESGFTVLDLNSEGELVTVVGTLPDISVGEELSLTGEWTFHPVFGRQFRAELCQRYFPASAAAMLKYLSSGVIKGIGAATAEKIVSEFGDESFEVIEKHPERLAGIRGISKEKARAMSENFKKQFAVRQVMIYLESFGMTPGECLRAYKTLGGNTVDLINSNPYVLCSEGIDIGFDRADGIAQSMPNKPEKIFRIRAGVLYVVTHNLYNGHTCVPRDKLISPSSELLGVQETEIDEAIDDLVNTRRLIQRSIKGREFVFLPKIYFAESSAAKRLKILLQYPPAGKSTLEKDIDIIEKKLNINYADKQREAITTAVKRGMLILTGGPGTGKTTILNGILELYERDNLNVALAAPTGRAAKRMSEVTGREAKTLHRLLEVEWDQNERQTFARNISNPIDADALIVDELSMVDIQLFSALLDALPLGCRLIMVGDSDQLPPVGAGNVLNDMITSGLLPVVELREVFRQALESRIVTNAHKIVAGEMPDLKSTDSDFFYMERLDAQKAIETVTQLCTQRLPKAYGYSPITDIQVLCPSKKGELGTKNLNRALQSALNPPARDKKEITVNAQTLRAGDKVMQIKNNYDIPWSKGKENGTGIFNGDVGILQKIDTAAASFSVLFDDRTAVYSIENIKELELAYAVTVHKSQGSEFPAVIMPLLNIAPQLSYRNLLYTAVTRAKDILIIVGSEEQVVKMIENDKKTKRFSALKEFMLCDGY